jgi:16S rRNA (guanine(966)-N(2))-methyltransferase RsmD
MRIVAGKYKGRKLAGPKGSKIRPTGDRLKETLFDVLAWAVGNSVFLDLFAGTGSIGLEALSRGAREVIFVESSDEACRLICKNLELCRIREGYRLVQQDIFTSLRQFGREGLRADIVYMDPPYGWGPYQDVLELLVHTGVVDESSHVVVEHSNRSKVPSAGSDHQRIRLLRQGNACLSFFSFGLHEREPE